LSSILAFVASSPPDLYSCVDWDCEEWISKGKTLLRYHAKTTKHLSFKPNEDIYIVSKPVDKSQPDWVGKVGNKIGLVPKDMVREDKMSKSPLKFKHLFHEIPILTNQEEVQYEDDEAVTDSSNEAGIEIEDVDVADSSVDVTQKTFEPFTKPEISEQNEATASVTPHDSSTFLNEIVEPSSVLSEAVQSQSVSVESIVSVEEGTTQVEQEAINESVLDGINLQPSTDTVLQGTTTVDYLPETPKTEAHKPTDDVTPKIPETVVLDSVSSIQSSNIFIATETSSLIEPISVSRVEESSVIEEQSQIETKSDQHLHTANEVLVHETDAPSDQGIETANPEPETTTTVEEEITTQVPVKEEETVVRESISSAQEADMSTPVLSPDKVLIQEVLKQDVQDDVRSSSEPGSLPTSGEQPASDLDKLPEEEEIAVTPSPEENLIDSAAVQSVPVDQTSSEESVTSKIDDAGEIDAIKNDLNPESDAELKVEPEITFSDESIETSSETPQELKDDKDESENADQSENIESNEVDDNKFISPETEGEVMSTSESSIPVDVHLDIPLSTESTPTDEHVSEPEEIKVVPDIPDSTNEEVTTDSLSASTEVPSSSVPAENNSEIPETVSQNVNIPHDHHDHHHHHHHHHPDQNDKENSSIVIVIKHLSSTLLSFLPEHLQDTILDVDDALVFTGIIALTLVSICVPYFLIEGYMSGRDMKKKVVELNKSLWKVSAAYETQQEEFELFKQKAIAHDEFKKRAEQSENDLVILKKLETKHREQITALKTQQKTQMKEAVDIRAMIEKTLEDKKVVVDECEKYKAGYENAKEALMKAKEELGTLQVQAKSSALQLGISSRNTEVLTAKITMLEQEVEDMKSQLASENEKRRAVEVEKQEVEQSKATVEKELVEFKNICHQYEDTVSGLNDEISKLESELVTLKETLGEDSPLVEIAEIQAKAAFAEKEKESLRTRLNGLNADNENLSGKLASVSSALDEAQSEKEQANNRLQVLETYFKEREEEYIKTIEQLQLKESVRDKGKEELIRMIEEKENVCKDLNERLEALKAEYEDTKQQHRKEIRDLEAKDHEKWLSLCQAERKAQDARKDAELLRQRLTAMSKEKDDDVGDGLNGEVPSMYSMLTHDLVPPPLMDDPPSYFGLGVGSDFVPPPPLPDDDEREPNNRPPPLGGIGGRLSPFSDIDDASVLSPIGQIGLGRREDVDHTDGSSGSDSPTGRSPMLGRGGWVNVQHDRDGDGRQRLTRPPATSSPIQHGVNL
ncbi:Transport and Golgi organization protein 1, partial [Orchesella cincta]